MTAPAAAEKELREVKADRDRLLKSLSAMVSKRDAERQRANAIEAAMNTLSAKFEALKNDHARALDALLVAARRAQEPKP